MMNAGRLFLVVLLPLLLFSACAEQPFAIDEVALFPTAVFSRLNDLALSQSGLVIAVSSEDLDEKQAYQIRFESPSMTGVAPYIWEQTAQVTQFKGSPALVLNAVLMPGETPFPDGAYSLEIITPSGTVARHTVRVSDQPSPAYQDAGLQISEVEGTCRVVTSLPDEAAWSGEVLLSGQVYQVSSDRAEVPLSELPDGQERDTVRVSISYYDDTRDMQIVHRLLTQSILPTER